TLLGDSTSYAFVSGAVFDGNNNPLNHIEVADGAGRTAFSASNGRYFLLASPGDIQLTANPNDASRNWSYVTELQNSSHTLVAGTLYDESSWSPTDTTDFRLALGGMIKGYFRTASNTA